MAASWRGLKIANPNIIVTPHASTIERKKLTVVAADALYNQMGRWARQPCRRRDKPPARATGRRLESRKLRQASPQNRERSGRRFHWMRCPSCMQFQKLRGPLVLLRYNPDLVRFSRKPGFLTAAEEQSACKAWVLSNLGDNASSLPRPKPNQQ